MPTAASLPPVKIFIAGQSVTHAHSDSLVCLSLRPLPTSPTPAPMPVPTIPTPEPTTEAEPSKASINYAFDCSRGTRMKRRPCMLTTAELVCGSILAGNLFTPVLSVSLRPRIDLSSIMIPKGAIQPGVCTVDYWRHKEIGRDLVKTYWLDGGREFGATIAGLRDTRALLVAIFQLSPKEWKERIGCWMWVLWGERNSILHGARCREAGALASIIDGVLLEREVRVVG
ncbi:Uncharacterized protein Fot_22376 [Forsythia ovata]|uniref:Uncharacterized protein n=1 Tax=Forsythia ovata TaxID=205694 RepID=A0ABD1UZ86_9LAMI